MRTAGRSNFLKPWGIIKEGLSAGTYTLTIHSNYNSDQYNSHKNVKLSSVGVIGARNFTLPIVLIVFGVVFIVGCVVFVIKYRMTEGKFGPKAI